jgi:hypothetical protein
LITIPEIYAQVTQLQLATQAHAAQGLLSCEMYKKVFNQKLITTIALNILTGVAFGMTLSPALSMVIPLAFGLTSLGLMAYNIDTIYRRYLSKQQAFKLEPIFSEIIQGNYVQAFAKVNAYLQDLSTQVANANEGRLDSLTLHIKSRALEDILPINDGRIYSNEYMQRFHLILAVLKALKNNEHEEIFIPQIRLYETTLRCGYQNANKNIALCRSFNERNLVFTASSVNWAEKILFDDLVSSLIIFNHPSVYGEEPCQRTLKYLRDIRDFAPNIKIIPESPEEEQVQRNNQLLTAQKIDRFLECKTFEELVEAATIERNNLNN